MGTTRRNKNAVKSKQIDHNKLAGNKTEELQSDISTAEGIMMTTLWCLYVIYIGYNIYLDSNKIVKATFKHFLPGWKFTQRLKDLSNLEWELWHDFWTKRAWPVMLGHVLVNLTLSATSQQIKLLANIAYSILALWWLLNWKILTFLLSYITFGFLIASTGYRVLIWSSALMALSAIAVDVASEWASRISDDGIYKRKQALMISAVTMITLRFVSFGLDWLEHQQSGFQNGMENDKGATRERKSKLKVIKEQEVSIIYNYINFLHFTLYVPLFFIGPMFNYDQFQKEYWNPTKVWTGKSVKSCITYGLRTAFSYIVCELMLHYMYFNAAYHSDETMESVSFWTLAGFHFYHGQFFTVKYVVLYGLPRFLAMTDHLDAPMTPSCIGRIGGSLSIWRTFDRGLYIFMKRYIYFPIRGANSGVLRKVLGSALCFAFIFVWHGLTMAVFLWVSVNFIDLALEAFADFVNALPAIQKFQDQHLTKATTRRLKCLLRAPLKLFTSIAVNVFFAQDVNIGLIYFKRLVFEGFFTYVFVFYCLGHTDYFISNIELRRKARNSKHSTIQALKTQ